MTPEETRKFFAQPCDFMRAAAEPSQFPPAELPEVAFIGRSNVGKSSLINALTGRKLARASNTPGRTQQIVFFNLANKLMLVDLPGYGHADAPSQEKERWNGLVRTYLRKREVLKSVCLLLDSRHEVKANDLEMMTFLDRCAVPYRLILTKTDRIKAIDVPDVIERIEKLAAQHPAALSGALATSSETKTGINTLQMAIAE
ncbi:MAG: ribosome biogenesis GTP-binding protein YihA/YsxC [Alphaproteobacteria bacterium]|nr:ribosome biogenesis GTP-binding protein YihA/YsxC [Alphaproteobacteria bacterium]